MPELMTKMYEELKEVKIELRRLSSLVEESFELSDETKKELEKARKEDINEYDDHEEVMKEFS